jgi:DeoR/GlpR family transcriptional regulator of sugar metabolism
VDIAFFGARGITARDGMTETDIGEAALKQRMVHQASMVVGVADSSKFSATYFSAFALPHEIDRIITDVNVPANIVSDLRSRDVLVDLV